MASDPPAVCPVCKLADHTSFFMSKEGYDLFRCSDCQHIFVWPMPGIDELKRIYSSENSYQLQERIVCDETTKFLEKTRVSLREVEEFCVHRERLLDVGCSAGDILWLAKRDGWSSIYGVEINGDTADIARANGADVFTGELKDARFPPAFFDAIHIGDVIEHVRDPADLLRCAESLLRPDGVVVVVTPNHHALFPTLTYWLYRFLKIPWSHPTPPYHLNQFSDSSLEKLARGAGLTVRAKRYRPCALDYEIAETHVVRSFRQAMRQRRPALAGCRLSFALFAVFAYVTAYGIDRCCFWKTRDFEMHFILGRLAGAGMMDARGSV